MRKRTRLLLVVVGVILALTVGLTTVAFASGSSEEQGNADSTAGPSIALDPSSGAACTLVTVTATRFAANSDLTLTFGGTELAWTKASVTTDDAGSASGTFRTPIKAAGDYEVVVTDGAGNSASATFEEQSTPGQTFISKVANILGLPEEQVAAAFKQARQEMQDEALQNWLQKLVDEGRITQEEADQYLEWWQSRPDINFGFGDGFQLRGGCGRGHRGGGMGRGPGPMGPGF
ncbi:MAG: hypothetical protein FJ012_06275 [Chloroflexi bacterium]|nr:hypothetical protein [Chloroflexota bacterium]